ncbi:MAG: alpha-isopropylmalate synthase regulatory domain-containing protein [Pseudonocardiaceae bacterium]
MSVGDNAAGAAYVECTVNEQVLWGVGVSGSIVAASLNAVASAVNRTLR